jgi:hypothetical protein
MARHAVVPILGLLCALAMGGVAGCYSPTLPLPPPVRDGLTISPPDADGWVLVTGEQGVMDAGEQAVIINANTLYGWIVPVTEDGFEVEVLASAGDVLSIQRRSGDELGQSIQIVVPSE